ncbi:MAG TPA: hypothetical protein VFY96_12915 [Candidatus Binatia bacterium]|nr:hypothetical protein [Candidatus Binatia bacterium]
MKNFFWLILITFFGLVCRSAGAAEFQAGQCVQAENDGFMMLLGLFFDEFKFRGTRSG